MYEYFGISKHRHRCVLLRPSRITYYLFPLCIVFIYMQMTGICYVFLNVVSNKGSEDCYLAHIKLCHRKTCVRMSVGMTLGKDNAGAFIYNTDAIFIYRMRITINENTGP